MVFLVLDTYCRAIRGCPVTTSEKVHVLSTYLSQGMRMS